jgi:hypothetical protein
MKSQGKRIASMAVLIGLFVAAAFIYEGFQVLSAEATTLYPRSSACSAVKLEIQSL